ncbi:hypothetical protein BpHYR1_051976 [Brachionus plicatilis]|uniref:Uncharacterized protein n=1 Tax=Brachionus plicatilis TaxID=10195 RepID=A0A3M7Q7N3_BRAPC|nr:hypothetical protein BpHYR1_051976 [Brachionus plicatilis]
MVRLENGHVLFDINSTQLVKFERQSLHAATVNSSLSFHLKSIEKCIVKKNFFLNSNLSRSKILFHLKQIIFLDMSPGSIKNLRLTASSLKIYLVELISSFCVQPNTLSELSLQANSSLNFSVVQSKNVQFMSNSVSRIDARHSSLFIGVFDADLNDHDVNALVTKHHHSFDFYNQYYYTKQKYTYNLSVARNAFTLLNTEKLVIVADYLDTQWESCIEENLDFLSNGEVTDVLSYAEADANSTSVLSKSNVKITGLFIIGLVLLILFLILVVNLVQYKYRDDSFEEFESSIQTGNGGENLIKCENVEPEAKESQCMIKANDMTQMND